jgi:hypothetical protein
MSNPNTDQANEQPLVLDSVDGADKAADGGAGEERTFRTDTPDSRPDLDLADDTETGGATDADDSTFHTSTVQANRAIERGDGVGQEELDAQADPSRDARPDPLGQSTAEDNFKNITGTN